MSVVLIFALMLSLSACGQDPPEDSRGDGTSDRVYEAVGSGAVAGSPAESGRAAAPSSPEETARAQSDTESSVPEESSPEYSDPTPGSDGMYAISITVGGNVFAGKFYDSESTQALIEQMPTTLQMRDYAGQEKVVDLPYDFPPASTQTPSTIRTGDLWLWSGNSLVLFYTTFPNSYSYVPIGYIEETDGLAAALGSGDVSVTFQVF